VTNTTASQCGASVWLCGV